MSKKETVFKEKEEAFNYTLYRLPNFLDPTAAL